MVSRPPTEEVCRMWPLDCSRRTGTAAGVRFDDAPEIGLDLGAEVVLREVLNGVDVGIAGAVNENVQPRPNASLVALTAAIACARSVTSRRTALALLG
jgi:hypothetical protein